jgi:cell division protein FtsB
LINKVDGHHLTLYGEDGSSGLSGCIKKKVSWIHLGSLIVGIFVVFGIVFGGYGIYAMEKGDRKREESEKCITENKERIRVLEENFKNMNANIDEIKRKMVRKSDMDEKFNQIINAIKEKM